MYCDQREHDEDCRRYPFEHIPGRVFLDTNVINRLVKWGSQIFEHVPLPLGLDETLALDIEALERIFFVGRRANWDIVGSSTTLDELSRTRDPFLRSRLFDYGLQIVDLLPESEGRRFAVDFERRLLNTPFVAALPDPADRELVGQAIGLGCDTFCTCDRKTILSKRGRLRQLSLRILTPAEWWDHIRPWAALWC